MTLKVQNHFGKGHDINNLLNLKGEWTSQSYHELNLPQATTLSYTWYSLGLGRQSSLILNVSESWNGWRKCQENRRNKTNTMYRELNVINMSIVSFSKPEVIIYSWNIKIYSKLFQICITPRNQGRIIDFRFNRGINKIKDQVRGGSFYVGGGG